MAKILAVANQKGGVGKTTTSVNLAASLAATKRTVLMIDLDPQGNATMGAGIDKHELELSAYDVLVDSVSIADAAQTNDHHFDVLGSNSDLTGAEVALIEMQKKEFRLKQAIQNVATQYDYIIIDCPPSLNMLTINALVAADAVVIPMQCEYYALEGLSSLMDTIDTIRSALNPQLKIDGLLRTMYDPRNALSNQVSSQLTDHFGERVYRTIIPRNVRLAEAPSHGLPVLEYDKRSRGAMAYLALAGELIRRAERPQRDVAEPEVS